MNDLESKETTIHFIQSIITKYVLLGKVGSQGMQNTKDNFGDRNKVRARSVFTKDQLSTLMLFYKKNPLPKRQTIQRISEQIGHPFKVVKVWFQNSRARDRLKGRIVLDPTKGHLPASFFNYRNLAALGIFSQFPMSGLMASGGDEQTTSNINFSSFLEANAPNPLTLDPELFQEKHTSKFSYLNLYKRDFLKVEKEIADLWN